MNQLNRRIKKLETGTDSRFADVLRWIAQGLYYDELTDEQRTLYCQYHGIDRESTDSFNLWIYNNDTSKAFHYPLEKRQPPMTPEEERQHIRQVAAEIEQYLSRAGD